MMKPDITDRIKEVVKPYLLYPHEAKHVAAAVVAELKLEEETHRTAPVWEPVFDEEGEPVMQEEFVQPVQKYRLMWVTKRRWVTPYEEIGERITSEALQARLEAQHGS